MMICRLDDTPLGNADCVRHANAVSLLDKLRGVGTPRPRVDPELAGGLREWLEDCLTGAVATLGEQGRALRVDSHMLDGSADSAAEPSSPSHRGSSVDCVVLRALVRSLFRQWVTTGSIEDPLRDALEGQAASGDPEGAVDLVSNMTENQRHAFDNVVRLHAERIAETWPALSPAWFPRSHERLTIPLCGGRVMLAGIADLVVGPSAASEASVCLVEIETERRTREPRDELHFLALLETLRAGASPSRVATYYTRTGELEAEPVDEHLLVRALLRVVAGVEELCSRQSCRASRFSWSTAARESGVFEGEASR